MIQTALIQNAHKDLVTDASYDFYGLRLATSGLDQRIKVWALDEATGGWEMEEEWKAHDAAITKLSWAHPEFGPILASSSFDRTVKIWEEVPSSLHTSSGPGVNGTPSAAPGMARTGSGSGSGSGGVASGGSGGTGTGTRWVERTTLTDAKGSVRAVEFAPRHFGLKIASISSDNVLRIYTCLEQPNLTSWTTEEYDIAVLPAPSSIPSARNDNINHGSSAHNITEPTGSGTGHAPNATRNNLTEHPSSSTLGPSSSGIFASSSTLGPTSSFTSTVSTTSSGSSSSFGQGHGLGSGAGGGGAGSQSTYGASGASQGAGIGQHQQQQPGTTSNPASGLGPGSASNASGSAFDATGANAGAGPTNARPGVGIREADGGWCVSWCKEHYWGELVAVGWGVGGVVKIINFNPSRRAHTLLALEAPPPTTTDPTPSNRTRPHAQTQTSSHSNRDTSRARGHQSASSSNVNAPNVGAGDQTDDESNTPTPYAITSVAWAPSCGRSFHLVATGSRDGRVRVWKLRPGAITRSNGGAGVLSGGDESEESVIGGGGMQPVSDMLSGEKWTAGLVAEFDDHEACVGRVEWNITGTVLSSAGNDGRVRLWKQTVGGVWRAAGTISVEQSDERGTADVEME